LDLKFAIGLYRMSALGRAYRLAGLLECTSTSRPNPFTSFAEQPSRRDVGLKNEVVKTAALAFCFVSCPSCITCACRESARGQDEQTDKHEACGKHGGWARKRCRRDTKRNPPKG